jgi:hypothetical protein
MPKTDLHYGSIRVRVSFVLTATLAFRVAPAQAAPSAQVSEQGRVCRDVPRLGSHIANIAKRVCGTRRRLTRMSVSTRKR